jgi:lipoprotein-releasing system ATP-binding protein
MIEVKNIVKSYQHLSVLKGIDLRIDKGEIVSIVGASGAGKTTLLQIMGTLDRADSGSVLINNTDVTKLRGRQLAAFRNHHIGFVFQFHQLLPEFSALENVSMPGWIGKRNDDEVKRQAMETLQFLGLAHRIHHKPSELSGGEQQRVAVARALVNNPDVILADEPSGNLDSNTASSLHDLFFELRKQFNQTFIIATHNEQLAHRSDRMLTIRDGVII